jgi:hypothetical protein
MQREELRLQREELALTRKELERSALAQENSARLLEEQRDLTRQQMYAAANPSFTFELTKLVQITRSGQLTDTFMFNITNHGAGVSKLRGSTTGGKIFLDAASLPRGATENLRLVLESGQEGEVPVTIKFEDRLGTDCRQRFTFRPDKGRRWSMKSGVERGASTQVKEGD